MTGIAGGRRFAAPWNTARRFGVLPVAAGAGLAFGAFSLPAASGAEPPAQERPHRRGGAPVAGEGVRSLYAPPSLPELLDRAQTVVAGEVLNMRSDWTPDRRQIFTTVTLRTDRRFKGGGESLVRFRIPGGTVGDTRLMVTHSPRFSVGERALVFLAGESGRLPRVVAGEAGKRHLREGDDGQELILPGFALSEGTGGAASQISDLEDLATAVRRLAAQRPR